MKRTTKAEKLATWDAIKADADKLQLAMYDLANHKFGVAVTRLQKDFDADLVGATGRYTVAMSWRAMPLFLVRYISTAVKQNDQIQVLTDDEIQVGYREHPTSVWWRMVMHARNELLHKQMARTQEAN